VVSDKIVLRVPNSCLEKESINTDRKRKNYISIKSISQFKHNFLRAHETLSYLLQMTDERAR
jgi:hypothetical protein